MGLWSKGSAYRGSRAVRHAREAPTPMHTYTETDSQREAASEEQREAASEEQREATSEEQREVDSEERSAM